jgi:hypothetical protein
MLLVMVAMWLAILMIEFQHQRRRCIEWRGLARLAGYGVAALSAAAPLFGIQRGSSAFGSGVALGMMVLAGVVLGIAVWPDWDRRMRVLAPFVCLAGVAMSIFALRTEDSAWLGRGWHG